MSYFVCSQSIGEEWWEISIIFLVLISTKGTEESSALGSIIIDLIKTCSFCTQINSYDQVMVYGITIWFARRWDCNTPVEIHQFYDCQWIHLYKCMLTHNSMMTPYQLNYIPIRSWFISLHFISVFCSCMCICGFIYACIYTYMTYIETYCVFTNHEYFSCYKHDVLLCYHWVGE